MSDNQETRKEKASLIAPVIRMLAGHGKGVVVVDATTDTIPAGAIEITAAADGTVADEEIRTALAGKYPALVAVKGIGVFACGETKRQADAVLQSALSGNKSEFNASRGTGRVAGKITIVTGSAQGFGKGIAEDLLAEGAYVVVADVNEPLSKQVAEEFCSKHGEGRAVAVKVDVTQEESIKNLLVETVLAFGGIDVFVANAGILKAGSLEEMELRSFDLVTKINYTAYFLCTKYAARYMKIQTRVDRSCFCDIIQINSKSGLSGSNKNFAYAGGKFGGLGLTQSFALELIEYNIKVNSICPGNFFGGPLWMDPENGLFAQYLRAGKVPGAKSVEDVKRFYEAKVPMNRGCEPRDVALALFYAIEQNYETGQAIPVTGGQVMLK